MGITRHANKSFCLALVLFLLPSVLALQLSPAAKTLTYGEHGPYSLTIINDAPREQTVTVTADPRITITPAHLTLQPKEKAVVTIAFSGNEEDLRPGDNTFPVVVTLDTGTAGQFGAGVALAHKLIITRLYEGAFLAGELHATKDRVVLVLRNKGLQGTEVTGALTLGGAERVVQADVPASSARKLEEELPPLPRGQYEAHAVLSYTDGENERRLELKEPFRIGRPRIMLGRPRARLIASEISAVTIPVTVDWNTPVEAYAVLQLLQNGTVRTQEVTSSGVLRDELTGYLEAPSPGTYVLRASLHSRNGDRLTEGAWNVSVQSAETPGPQKTPAPSTSLLAVLGLVALFVVAFLTWRLATTRR
ncbi:hypothetical protein D6789_03715 [Candidatus Woesearchaeota archaeon]|nr:MAG: hypothetical protein D6789_03715 [Candidatus Woesearchaeota archaeon]